MKFWIHIYRFRIRKPITLIFIYINDPNFSYGIILFSSTRLLHKQNFNAIWFDKKGSTSFIRNAMCILWTIQAELKSPGGPAENAKGLTNYVTAQNPGFLCQRERRLSNDSMKHYTWITEVKQLMESWKTCATRKTLLEKKYDKY